MSTTIQLQQARERGYEGAARAATHAGTDWQQAAFYALCAFAADTLVPFTVEQVREKYAAELGEPPDGRAWGQIATRARRCGAIVACGYAPTKSSNGSPKVLWRWAGQREQQLNMGI
jgi:hypothetical protein